jgi:hypothetical protein
LFRISARYKARMKTMRRGSGAIKGRKRPAMCLGSSRPGLTMDGWHKPFHIAINIEKNKLSSLCEK